MYGCVYLYYSMYSSGDNAPLYLVIALSEVINGIIGWGFMIFYLIKYYRLYILNVNKKDIKEDD